MRLKIIQRGTWKVVTPLDARGDCPLEAALEALASDPRTEVTLAGFLQLWKRIPIQGPKALGTNFYHLVDEENEIYEFIKRNHRITAFSIDGAIVVCSSLFLKQGRKTPAQEKRNARDLRQRCLESIRSGSLQIIDDGEDKS